MLPASLDQVPGKGHATLYSGLQGDEEEAPGSPVSEGQESQEHDLAAFAGLRVSESSASAKGESLEPLRPECGGGRLPLASGKCLCQTFWLSAASVDLQAFISYSAYPLQPSL